ncbi:MAG: hypothetical protein Tsb0013_13670 [Phycisphaerales bacterium]
MITTQVSTPTKTCGEIGKMASSIASMGGSVAGGAGDGHSGGRPLRAIPRLPNHPSTPVTIGAAHDPQRSGHGPDPGAAQLEYRGWSARGYREIAVAHRAS